MTQAAFRRRLWRRRETKARQQRIRDKKIEQRTASCRLQRAWRRHKARLALDRRKRGKSEVSTGIATGAVDDDHASKGPLAGGHPPNATGGPLNSPANVSRGPSGDLGAPTNNQGASWQSWSSSPFGMNPALAAEIAREGEDKAADSARPWTAAGAVESSGSKPSGAHPHRPQPPVGMMTVTVRRGSEETSLVTPIVLTENGEEGDGTTAVPPAAEAAGPGGVMVTANSTSLSKGGESGESRPSAVLPTADGEDAEGTKGRSVAVDGRESAENETHARKSVAKDRVTREPEYRLGGSAEVMTPTASKVSSIPAPQMSTNKATSVGATVSLPPTKVVTTHPSATKRSSANPVAAGAAAVPGDAKISVGQRGSLTAGAPVMTNSGQDVPRAVVKPEEQLFMEDTQLYLGCAVCGVKYLVEAVDPGPSKPTQGDLQKATSTIFLCFSSCLGHVSCCAVR